MAQKSAVASSSVRRLDLLVLILAFATIGAFFISRSFAASGDVRVFWPEEIYDGSGELVDRPNSPHKILRSGSNFSFGGSYNTSNGNKLRNILRANQSKRAKLCINAKLDSSVAGNIDLGMYGTANNRINNFRTMSAPLNSSYANYCMVFTITNNRDIIERSMLFVSASTTYASMRYVTLTIL